MEESIGMSLDDKKVVGAEVVKEKDVFQCSICMDHPTDSVLTKCGHLFCWSCLSRWLQNTRKLCPVCKVRVGLSSITPIYGCQGGSSSKSIPPHLSVLLKHRRARQSSGSLDTTNISSASNSTLPPIQASNYDILTLRLASLQHFLSSQLQMESSMHDLQLESLILRAQVNFREIRASHPPSPIVWIAEASNEFARNFDPLLPRLEGVQINDLSNFVSNILVGQGEYVPTRDDFQRSWLPYYQAQNPRLSQHEHYIAFLEAWCMHFWIASLYEENQARASTLVLPREPSSSVVGSTSTVSHQEPLLASEPEVQEMDTMEYNQASRERRASRHLGGLRRSRRLAYLQRRPY